MNEIEILAELSNYSNADEDPVEVKIPLTIEDQRIDGGLDLVSLRFEHEGLSIAVHINSAQLNIMLEFLKKGHL